MHVALSVTGATGCILYWVTVEAFVRLSGEPAKYVRSDAREGGGWVVWERRKRILHCCRELVLPEFGLQESYCLFRHFSSKFRQKSGIANACNFLGWFHRSVGKNAMHGIYHSIYVDCLPVVYVQRY